MNKKIFIANDLPFVYKKNAKAENNDIQTLTITEKEFFKGITDGKFLDAEDWKKNNPSFKPETEENGLSDIKDIEEPEEKKEDLKEELKKLTDRLNRVEEENKALKNGGLNMSFEKARELYLQKAELLRDLAKYQTKKDAFESLEIVQPDDDGLLSYKGYSLTFAAKPTEGYREEDVLKTSNKLIINEFIPFIISKLDIKIESLKKEVETLSFI